MRNFVKCFFYISVNTTAESVWIFQIPFDLARISISSTQFRFFWFSHITAMKADAVGETSKGSEAYTPSTSCMHDQQLLLMCITSACRLLLSDKISHIS